MHHFYADDTQLYVTLDPNQDPSTQLESLDKCIADIQKKKQSDIRLKNDVRCSLKQWTWVQKLDASTDTEI